MAEDGISVAWDGLKELFAKIDEVSDQADAAAKTIVTRAAALAENATKANFSGAHKRGEPHVGGSQPNVVTGTLRRSIRADPATRDGNGQYSTRVAPRVIYARRVELGYRGSKGYPYFRPGVEKVAPQFQAIAKAEWGRFLKA